MKTFEKQFSSMPKDRGIIPPKLFKEIFNSLKC
jgi:hypothetical protein